MPGTSMPGTSMPGVEPRGSPDTAGWTRVRRACPPTLPGWPITAGPPWLARPCRGRPRGPRPHLQADGCSDNGRPALPARTRLCARAPARPVARALGRENDLHWVLDVTVSEDASLVRRRPRPAQPRDPQARGAQCRPHRHRQNRHRQNSIRHTMREAVLDVRVLADTLNHMPIAWCESPEGRALNSAERATRRRRSPRPCAAGARDRRTCRDG